MICVSVMLAMIQFWPMIFGQQVTPQQVAQTAAPSAQAATATSAALVPAVAAGPVRAIKAASQAPVSLGQVSCYKRYQIAVGACSPRDRACRMKAADQWDLCEATGFWGN